MNWTDFDEEERKRPETVRAVHAFYGLECDGYCDAFNYAEDECDCEVCEYGVAKFGMKKHFTYDCGPGCFYQRGYDAGYKAGREA